MMPNALLEEDILDIFYGSWQPLTVQDVWEQLCDEGICVPILYLSKVIHILEESGYLRRIEEIRGLEAYQARSFWDRFKPRLVVSLVRGAVKMKQAPRIQKLKLVTAILLSSWILALDSAYCDSEPLDFSPVELTQAAPGSESENAAQPVNPATASSPPVILTTRPSFTDAWLTVPQGSLQVENGATYTDNSDKTRSWILPESLLKVGVTDNTEFRFSVPNYTYLRQDDEGKIINNLGDITAGISHHVALPKKIDLAIIPFLNIPTGANNISSNALDPQLRMVVAKYLTPKLVVASQIDARWNTGKNRAAAVVLNPTGIAYYSFTDKLSGFLEYGGFIPTTGKTQQFIQGGALYLLTKRQQVDIRIATGLNRHSSDIVVGFGYSFRIDGLFGKSKAYSTFVTRRQQ